MPQAGFHAPLSLYVQDDADAVDNDTMMQRNDEEGDAAEEGEVGL